MAVKELKEIKQGDKIVLEGNVYSVKRIEQSEVAKHGKSKCRLELEDDKGNKKLLIRLSDFQVETR